jgi:hypothetical protein
MSEKIVRKVGSNDSLQQQSVVSNDLRTPGNFPLDEGERLFRKFCKRAEKYVKKMKLLNLANENLKKLKPKNISFKLS